MEKGRLREPAPRAHIESDIGSVCKNLSSNREKDRGSQWHPFNVSLEHRLEGLPSILDFVQICKDEPGLRLPPRASVIVKLEMPG